MGFRTGPFYIRAIKFNYREGLFTLVLLIICVYFGIDCDRAQIYVTYLLENLLVFLLVGFFFLKPHVAKATHLY